MSNCVASQIPGGGPMQLSGPITLCGRSDLDPTRFFSGSIANLMLFDTPLRADQVGTSSASSCRLTGLQYLHAPGSVVSMVVNGFMCAAFQGCMALQCALCRASVLELLLSTGQAVQCMRSVQGALRSTSQDGFRYMPDSSTA